jgi:hypothetical protein
MIILFILLAISLICMGIGAGLGFGDHDTFSEIMVKVLWGFFWPILIGKWIFEFTKEELEWKAIKKGKRK